MEQLCIYLEKKIFHQAVGSIQMRMRSLICCRRFTANQHYGILIQSRKRLQRRYAR
jgi:hypothetical protein